MTTPQIYVPRFQRTQLREAIRETYSEVALDPSCSFHFTTGRTLAARLGYAAALLAIAPDGAINSFAGVGNPFMIGPIHHGDTVLDLGSGAGTDSLIAARLTGEEGEVIGIDMTSEMIGRARRNASDMGLSNVRFELGFAESLPVEDNSVDVVISNGVINLCPDKSEVFSELYRVLKPGGRLQIADVLLETPVPTNSIDLIHLWTDCVAGGLLKAEYIALLEEAGFRGVEITASFDVFADAAVAQSASRFGAKGYNIRGWK